MLANNPNEVVQCLDAIIAEAITQNSSNGLFASLYRLVTIKLLEGIENNFFDDAARMQDYITKFANRYFDAFDAYKRGENLTKSWKIAFAATERQDLLIVQHLILGANAHINLDLGIVAAEICPGDKLQTLQSDFHKTNYLFADLLNSVQQTINQFSPKLNMLDTIGGQTDEFLLNFSFKKARDCAWEIAELLAYEPSHHQKVIIKLIDSKVALLSRFITEPGQILDKVVDTIKQAENHDNYAIINALNAL